MWSFISAAIGFLASNNACESAEISLTKHKELTGVLCRASGPINLSLSGWRARKCLLTQAFGQYTQEIKR